MFESARLKLTAWYLLIIMLISVFFSVVIYGMINQEYNRFEHAQRLRQEIEQRLLAPNILRQRREQEDLNIANARERLRLILVLVNLGILGIAGLAGYFLAGRTLRPIKQMLDEQNRFITDASHELRTPLTALKSEIEVNLRDKSLSIASAKRLLSSNLEEVNNLQLLSDSLIKLAQYQKGEEGINFETVMVSEVSEEACRKVSALSKRKNISIKNLTGLQTLEANRQSLVELLVIFLDNAIKYSKKNTTITINSKLTDHSILIDVKDQGVGIKEEEISRLFERFYRVDQSRTKRITGYGLGLSIAKQIVDKHHGTIKVKSEIGKGTTFSITLPLKQPGKDYLNL